MNISIPFCEIKNSTYTKATRRIKRRKIDDRNICTGKNLGRDKNQRYKKEKNRRQKWKTGDSRLDIDELNLNFTRQVSRHIRSMNHSLQSGYGSFCFLFVSPILCSVICSVSIFVVIHFFINKSFWLIMRFETLRT